MTVHPTAKNLAKDIARQAWPKRQPRQQKMPKEFPNHVKKLMAERSGGICELDACGPVQVYHHRRPRGSGGSSLGWVNRAANGLALSDHCHLKVEGRLTGSSRMVSHVNGWLVSMNGHEIAADVPVLYRGRWVRLADNGGAKEIAAMDSTQPVCPDCWVILHPNRVPPLIRSAELETCSVCGHPTVSGLTAPVDLSPLRTEENE